MLRVIRGLVTVLVLGLTLHGLVLAVLPKAKFWKEELLFFALYLVWCCAC